MSNASPLFNRASQNTASIHQSYTDYAKRFGLNHNELLVAYALVTLGACTQKQIGLVREIPKQTIHNICKKWIDQALILVSEGTDDKREKLLRLSERGDAFFRPIIEPLLELENQCLAAFGEAEMQVFLSYFEKMRGIIAQHIGLHSLSNKESV